MAVSGILMVLFLIVHMLGNLKFFFGAESFDHYAAWLRTIATPLLPHGWYLWIQRVGLLVIVVAHIASATILTKRDHDARPVRYRQRPRSRGPYTTATMRYGGIIVLLFVIYHLLDLTALKLNPNGVEGAVYDNVVADFKIWYVWLSYTIAMLAIGAHLDHGFWSAAHTLGLNSPRRDRALKLTGHILAAVLTVGFLFVPWAVFLRLAG